MRGVRPRAPRPRQGHHDLHATDEVHVQVRTAYNSRGKSYSQSGQILYSLEKKSNSYSFSNMMAGTEPAGKRQRVA